MLVNGYHMAGITPVLETEITEFGRNYLCFLTSEIKYKGRVPYDLDLGRLIKVGTNAYGVLKHNLGSLRSIFDLYEFSQEVRYGKEDKGIYDRIPLSKAGEAALKASFESPVTLREEGDYFEIFIALNETISEEEPYPEISFTFDLKQNLP